jgi:hypothetical protein
MMASYNIIKKLDYLQKAISTYIGMIIPMYLNIGHLNYFIHKISPAGHWMMIVQTGL